MKVTTSLIVLVALLQASSIGASDPGPDAGFQGLKWGDSPSDDMVVVQRGFRSSRSAIPMDLYWRGLQSRDEGARSVAGQATSSVSFYFHRHRLCRVEVLWDEVTAETFEAISAALTVDWGEPDAMSVRGDRAWTSAGFATAAVLFHDEVKEHVAVLAVADIGCVRQAGADHGIP